jgi:hypothetical protein
MKNPLWRAFDEGSRGIRGWGVVRDDIMRRKVIWAPVPLHILFRFAERWWWWLAFRAGGLRKHRLDCPACGQRFERFHAIDDAAASEMHRLRSDLDHAERTIRRLRLERQQRSSKVTLDQFALRSIRLGLAVEELKLMKTMRASTTARNLELVRCHEEIQRLKAGAKDAMELYPETHVCFPGEPLP